MSSEGEVTSTSMSFMESVQLVLKQARINEGIVIGLRECVKALDSRNARLCVLAKNCDEPAITKLVEALCAEHSIPLIKIDDRATLGLWAGICKLDREGNPVKPSKSTVVCVTSVGDHSTAWDAVMATVGSSN